MNYLAFCLHRCEGLGVVLVAEKTMTAISMSADLILKQLADRPTEDWLTIGRVLSQLELLSRASDTGSSWQNVVADVLESGGTKMSPGHLHKIRRVYGFMEKGMKHLGLPFEEMSFAKLSSVEVAERLFRIDADAGYAALAACLRPQNPAKLTEIKALYDQHLASHPERMSPRQLGWRARRSFEGPHPEIHAIVDGVASDRASVSGQAIKQLFERMEREVISIIAFLEGTVAERDERIRSLEEELENTSLALNEALQDYENLSTDTRDLRSQRL